MSERNDQTRPEPLPAQLYDEKYFLTACEGYDEFLQSDGQNLSRRLKQAFEFASVQPGMKVLDLGCGRGEIVRHVARLGALAIGVDYSPVALGLAQRALKDEIGAHAIGLSDAKQLPFADGTFDRVLVFDVVEHLHPWELNLCLTEARRVLKPAGQIVIHTAPNRWYDAYAYPLVRQMRRLMGQGRNYPADPRALNVEVNTEVHVNEQDILRMRQTLRRAGFQKVKVWLDTPPQQRQESRILSAMRHIAFNWIPFAWFFEREVFAVASHEP